MTIFLVTGVAGSGKTFVAANLAARLQCPFQEGDDFHPAANRLKMASGHKLDDADRAPWLARIGAWIRQRRLAGETAVISCSLLKRAYRDAILPERDGIVLVFLNAAPALIRERLAKRQGHFFPPSLMQSQFDVLEPPADDEDAIIVDAAAPPEDQLRRILTAVKKADP